MGKSSSISAAERQCGERALALAEAFDAGMRAVSGLGLTARLEAVTDADPGAWLCTLHRGEDIAHGALGMGKGHTEASRVGAVFEALEHHLSGVDRLTADDLTLRSAYEVATGEAARDKAVALLAEGPDEPLACLSYDALTGGPGVWIPLFLSVPDYLEDHSAALRTAVGDDYPYVSVGRYSVNSGWAGGSDVTEASVHGLNEIIERDALSLLLVDQFLSRRPGPLRVVDPATLPQDLAELLAAAEAMTGQRVWIIDMTTDVEVPAYTAYVQPTPGEPSHVRGCGASLSRSYAIERSLTELIQQYLGAPLRDRLADQLPTRRIKTGGHPRLHACYLADFAEPLRERAEYVAFQDTEAPGSPQGHLDHLLDVLTQRGCAVYRREQYVTDDLAVVNLFVPGMERFAIVTDGNLVLPGERGTALLHDTQAAR
ncbi:YcaO-like family protein [Streptomyces sp. NPDC060223]|uniref:YcaO-like family protein n=1 Tax=unclassified Streptomyces TaxID=2593676 RepID=UPI003638216C